MKPQFSISTLLLVTAVVAISTAGGIDWMRRANPGGDVLWFPVALVYTAPFWLPIAFVALAIGRKALTVRMAIVFAIAEAAAVGVSHWVEQF